MMRVMTYKEIEEATARDVEMIRGLSMPDYETLMHLIGGMRYAVDESNLRHLVRSYVNGTLDAALVLASEAPE